MNTLETRRTFLRNALWVCTAGLSLTAVGGALTLINDCNKPKSSMFVPIDSVDTSPSVAKTSEASTPAQTALTSKRLPDGWYSVIANGLALTLAKDSSELTFAAPASSDDQAWEFKWSNGSLSISNQQGSLSNNGTSLNLGASSAPWVPWCDADGNISLSINDMFLCNDNGKATLGTNVQAASLTFSNAQAPTVTKTQTESETKIESENADTTPSSGWYSANGNMRCIDPDTGKTVCDTTRVDPTDANGSIYDFDSEGNASWHLPTYDDLPSGAHGDVDVPNITQGDPRQRTIMYALSRVGCSYALGNQPHEFVCDGLTQWSYAQGTGEETGDASFQYALIKERDGDPWRRSLSELKPGDLVFFGQESLTYYAGSFGDYGYGDYHAGMVYADGKMINARGIGVTKDTDIAAYSTYNDTADGSSGLGWEYLGGGSPYASEPCRVSIPTTYTC